MTDTATTTTRTIGRPEGPMPEAAKESMIRKHQETRYIRTYLEALTNGTSKKGGYRINPEQAQARIETIKERLADNSISLTERLALIQKRRNTEAALLGPTVKPQAHDLEAAEADFAKVAKSYSERVGIEYLTWREMNVPVRVLAAAGIRPKAAPRAAQPAE